MIVILPVLMDSTIGGYLKVKKPEEYCGCNSSGLSFFKNYILITFCVEDLPRLSIEKM